MRYPKISSFSKEKKCEVAVIGGGAAGIAAAVAAARSGATVYLVEKYGFLGGAATGGLVNRFQIGPPVRGHPVIRGIFEEVCERLKAYDALIGDWFNEELLKMVAFDICEEAGVHLLLDATFYDVNVVENRVTAALLATKSGPLRLVARCYVDTTGDGDLCAFAGADYEKGRPIDGLHQPMTLMFRLSNVDLDKVQKINLEELWPTFCKEANIVTSRGKFIVFPNPELGMLTFCTTHVAKVDGVDVDSLTEAEITAHRQALAVYRFFKKHVPGCEKCALAETAPLLGVRETRRIIGDYVLTREDVLEGTKFNDAIGCSTSWIDIHSPDGEGVLHEYLIKDVWFEIPLRSLIVKGMENVLVAGRCLSATHEAQGAIRTIPTCMLTGQGAGVAAAVAAREKVSVRSAKISQVQKQLLNQGVWLGEHKLEG